MRGTDVPSGQMNWKPSDSWIRTRWPAFDISSTFPLQVAGLGRKHQGQSDGRTAFTLVWSAARATSASFPEPGQTQDDHIVIPDTRHITYAAMMDLAWVQMKSDLWRGLLYVKSFWEDVCDLLLFFWLNPLDSICLNLFFLSHFFFLLHEGNIRKPSLEQHDLLVLILYKQQFLPVGFVLHYKLQEGLMRNSC